MKFTIPGEAIPKGRPRFNRSTGTTYTPHATRRYETMVSFLAMAQRDKIESGPVKFIARIYTGRKRPPDWDNSAKAIGDALIGHAFTDDSQIIEAHVYIIKSKTPRVEVEIEPAEEIVED